MNVSVAITPFRSPARPSAIPMPQREPTRSALIVGINYSGANALRGCVEDAKRMESLLVSEYGLKSDRLIRLRDKDATRKNIFAGIAKLAEKPADHVHFVYSGHGTYLPDRNADELDKQDECLVPWDYSKGLILDDELWQMWRLFPSTTTIFLQMDCCHSATVAKGFSFAGAKQWARGLFRQEKPRFLDADTLSPRIIEATRAGSYQTRALVCGVVDGPADAEPVATIVSLSGCQDWQTSADARINGVWCGAMTHYFLQACKLFRKAANWKEVHAETERLLRVNGYPQIPALYTINSPDDAVLSRKVFQ